jgi:CheY-like chemotaxis protein
MDSLGQLATGIAHDFNNTMMAAYPWAELIRRNYSHDQFLQRAASRITDAVEQAKKVTHHLLDFAQPRPPRIVPVDLGETARSAVSMVRSVIPAEIDIHLMIDPRGVVAKGDEARIAQVLLNLTLNAGDAMPAGGHLTIEIRGVSESEASRWDVDRDAFVLLSVSDTGTGIENAVLERVFDPFFTTKGIGKGTGLGLAVAHRIVHDHQGTIHVDSVPGQGTTFYVLLPKGEAAPKADQPAPTQALPGILRGTQVLLVDDDLVIVEIIRYALVSEGMTVEVATTGPEAIHRVTDGFRPDIVILDLGLPEMSGDRVHALLRARMADLPIIVSSGYGDRERIDSLLRDRKTAYFQKPYRMEVLVRQIIAMLHGEGTSATAEMGSPSRGTNA